MSTIYLHWHHKNLCLYRWNDFENPPIFKNTANYSLHFNQIFLPVNLLRQPFFDRKTLSALNFGALGSFVGQQLTQGLIASVRQLYRENHPWLRADAPIERFQHRFRCLVDQYSINGNQTLGAILLTSLVNNCVLLTTVVSTEEKVAGITGLKAAFDAFDKQFSVPFAQLPDLEIMTQKQLFFLSFAQVGIELHNFISILYMH